MGEQGVLYSPQAVFIHRREFHVSRVVELEDSVPVDDGVPCRGASRHAESSQTIEQKVAQRAQNILQNGTNEMYFNVQSSVSSLLQSFHRQIRNSKTNIGPTCSQSLCLLRCHKLVLHPPKKLFNPGVTIIFSSHLRRAT